LVAEDASQSTFNKMILEDFGLECDIAENGKLLSKSFKTPMIARTKTHSTPTTFGGHGI
jgi:hypothetical protein